MRVRGYTERFLGAAEYLVRGFRSVEPVEPLRVVVENLFADFEAEIVTIGEGLHRERTHAFGMAVVRSDYQPVLADRLDDRGECASSGSAAKYSCSLRTYSSGDLRNRRLFAPNIS